ncbi:tyrosine-protein phosphatase [Subtercola endophyticus]|uniref:tyrosine-protein phosphatase n=1 Tax=Subtercola endophyticus TaxID=2895559 RepID=UPI001E2A9537|nr:tyrosine-protein phosphatase [Subtercola endophyticus]UFS60644.1 tyrosine-protein phosphatase [Subtercola endophyticus]
MTQTIPSGHLLIEGTYNFREVSGYRVGESAVRAGKLYRSDALHELTSGGSEAITDLGVRLVVDLRSDDEVIESPSLLRDEIVIVHSPIFTGAAQPVALGDDAVDLARIYDVMVDAYGAQLASAVRLIAESGDETVLVHCTAGKDRTGLVVALALLAVGVDRDEVVADYAQTAQHLAGPWADRMIEKMQTAGVPVTPALERIVTASPAAELERIIDRWESEWGSASGYLRAHGLTDDDITALATALLGRASDSTN